MGLRRFEGRRGAAAPRLLSGRGLSYWSDGKSERILYITLGFQLIALDAKTGQRAAGFGRDGRVDLKEPAIIGGGQRIDPVTGEIGVNNTPLVVGDVVVVGSAFSEQSGTSPTTHNNTKGLVQAYDIRTGKRLWVFRTIPMPGEFGNDTWEKDSWAVNGNNGVWTQMAADPELGLVYLPVETPTATTTGAIAPATISLRRASSRSTSRPDSAAGITSLCTIRSGGSTTRARRSWPTSRWTESPSKALAQPGKQSFLYVLDRATGRPVWPIEERPVPAGDVPGERYAPTQPIPTRPPAYDRQGYADDFLIDYTPELRAAALKMAAALQARTDLHAAESRDERGHAGHHRVERRQRRHQLAGRRLRSRNIRRLRAFAERTVLSMGSHRQSGPEQVGSPVPEGEPGHGPGPGRARSLNVEGLPPTKPPYGRISAINMDRGEIMWQIAHGETPGQRPEPREAEGHHPAAHGPAMRRHRRAGRHQDAGDRRRVRHHHRLRHTWCDAARYDKATGKEVGAVFMPAQQRIADDLHGQRQTVHRRRRRRRQLRWRGTSRSRCRAPREFLCPSD